MHAIRPQVGLDDLVEFEDLLLEISTCFVNLSPNQVDREIENAQRELCENLQLEHSSLWQIPSENPEALLMTHVFRDPTLAVPPANMDAREYFPWTYRKLLRNEIVCVANSLEVPPEAAKDSASWKQFGIRSTLAIPLLAGGHRVIGCLAFDSIRGQDWPEPLQRRLRLIAQLFAGALERKISEQKLLESEARLSLAASSASAGLWSLNMEKGSLWTTATARSLFGIQSEEMSYGTFLGVIHPEDRASVKQAIEDTSAAGDETKVEYRIVRPDGEIRWLVSRGTRYSNGPDKTQTLMGVVIDITDRKQSEEERLEISRRLLRAQESERSRIARELHDDIGQDLAILCIQMERAGKPVSDIPGKLHSDVPELLSRARDIAKKISQVSHQLHSSVLDHLGLKTAVEVLCRESASRFHIAVNCICENIPPQVDEVVALSLFRLAQEALHNLRKHSGAKHVDVRLAGIENNLSLAITDDGCGFDLDRALLGPGLGLISMRERIQAIGGQFEVVSAPGKGTRIHAQAPFRLSLSPAEPNIKPSLFSPKSRIDSRSA